MKTVPSNWRRMKGRWDVEYTYSTSCDKNSPCCDLVRLYAKMGLHGYNLLQGKNSQFSTVKDYNNNNVGGCAASSYYITLKAKDPAVHLAQTFQTRVTEGAYGRLILHCKVARPYGKTMTSDISRLPQFNYSRLSELMPKMPLENPFQHTKRFYVLNKSELQDNCIRLYLELAIATTNRRVSDPDSSKLEILCNLEILEAALESTAIEPSEGLGNGSDAIFYIRYNYSPKSHFKKDVDSVAIVRRICNGKTGSFTLYGQIMSSDTIPKNVMSV